MSSFLDKVTSVIDKLVSLVILIVTLRLVLYMFTNIWLVAEQMFHDEKWIHLHENDMLNWIVLYIILIKAYKVLISYTKHQHVSIRYVTELVIITCFVEFMFEQGISDMFRTILGTVGLGSLFLYLYFYDTIEKLDKNRES